MDEQTIGVGPHPHPWPEDPRLDPDLLENGDRRNVIDRYRYWRVDAIVEDLDRRRHGFHIAIENLKHDLNIGTVVRNANAFLAQEVHILGNRRWNRRGAMVTDRYQHLRHHEDFNSFASWAGGEDLEIIGIDLLPGSTSLVDADIPERCAFVIGQEGGGLSPAARQGCSRVLHIPQFGSTRSINAGVASGIVMFEWVRRHAASEAPET